MGLGHPAAGCSWTAWRSRRNAASPCLPTGGPLGAEYALRAGRSVEEFLALHAQCRGKETPPVEVLALANEITPEPVALGQSLNQLSGGQSRALMIADIALLCDSPIVLIERLRTPASTKSGRWACFSVMTSWCWWSPMTRTPP